ncbi:MAG: GrrA/OscA1 family cyclophane-containing rSAM-modified RiPP [Prochloraceae cyanobacterium]
MTIFCYSSEETFLKGERALSITTRISFMGFLLAVSVLKASTANATISESTSAWTSPNIENRLSRITKAVKQRETQHSEADERQVDPRIVAGFLNRRGGGGFVNRRGWVNGGGFLNRRWGDGGRFYNRW